jgi:hypothetical protein
VTPRLSVGLLALTLATACDARSGALTDTPVAITARPMKQAPRSAEHSILVTDDSVGSLPLVLHRRELARFVRIVRDTTEAAEEDMTNQVVVAVVDGDTVRVVVDEEGKVGWYVLRSPRFRTRDSLGVGTSLGQLLEVPGVYAKSSEGQAWVIVPQHCGLTFTMENDLGLDSPDSADVSRLSRLPKDTRVTEVSVFGCEKRRTADAPPPR